ncbi:hypothetical protein CYMTET_7797 [Cymbomonas tetramitiformis]|uniref:Uncharacterized protein n=1 Tax=Cymbomonas tetramitiformis TaxID=36881 RepID=A0AAE0GUJ1_9CHLO|nr:hypothetical protein CYMTET_7797 [Cymbomonas tetramitiformis]
MLKALVQQQQQLAQQNAIVATLVKEIRVLNTKKEANGKSAAVVVGTKGDKELACYDNTNPNLPRPACLEMRMLQLYNLYNAKSLLAVSRRTFLL